MTLVFLNAQNPGWVTTPDTSSVQISSINTVNAANCTIDQITTGVQFTPALLPGTLSSVTVNKDSTGSAGIVG